VTDATVVSDAPLAPWEGGSPDDVSAIDTVRILSRFMRHLSAGEVAPARVVEEVVHTASQHLGFERSAFLAVDRRGWIRGVTAAGMPLALIQCVSDPRREIALLNDAIENGETVYSPDVRGDGSIPQHYVEVFGMSTLVTAPLVVEGRLVGLMCFDQGGDAFELAEADRVVIDAFASQAALALRMSRLVADSIHAVLRQERLQLARRLHDTAAQLFYVIGTECDRSRSNPLSTVDAEIVARIESLAARGGQEIRRAIDLFRVSERTVKASTDLQDLLAELRSLYRCNIAVTGDWQGLDGDGTVWGGLLHVVREAVTNAVKHGRARNIVLWVRQYRRSLLLEVRDDGAAPSRGDRGDGTAGKGFGLADLRQQLAPHGGDLRLSRNDDGGHTLRVKVLRS
jgi:signal transduction histidine kinase